MAKPHTTRKAPVTQVSVSQEFHVGDYVVGKSGYYSGFIVAHSHRIVYFTWPTQVDDILFYGPPDDVTLIMPAAARAYFEQFVGDEGGE